MDQFPALQVRLRTVSQWGTGSRMVVPGWVSFVLVLVLVSVVFEWRAALVSRGLRSFFGPYSFYTVDG